jgi:predicted O-methyltransferase YrrM
MHWRKKINMAAPENDRLQNIKNYLDNLPWSENPLLSQLRAHTQDVQGSGMILGPTAARVLQLLVRMTGATNYLEVGTYTGCSSLSVALAMPDDGRIVACDVSEEYTAIAREFWAKAGVSERIDLRIGPAAVTLQAMLDDGAEGSFDIAFIDADKTGYEVYFPLCVDLVRPGGLILADNVLWGGRVADPAENGETTEVMRRFNDMVFKNEKVFPAILPVGDGMTVAWKV